MIYKLKNWNFWIMLLGDMFLISSSYYFAYFLRFDGNIPPEYLTKFMQTIIWIGPLKLVCFFLFGLYKGMWRYTGIYDLINLIKACFISTTIIVVLLLLTVRFAGFPRSVFIIDLFLIFLLVGGFRLGIRLYYARLNEAHGLVFRSSSNENLKRLLIIGAGDATEKIMREISDNPNLQYDVVGLIDDAPSKLNRTIHGVPVLGTLYEVRKIVKRNKINEILIAIPSASAVEMRRIINFCENTGLPFKTLPGIGELIEGKVSVSDAREVRYEDLLGREQVELVKEEIGGYLTGRNVMVTGGAGSIGWELCQQIALFNPDRLVILDQNESGLYEAGMSLLSRYPDLKTSIILGHTQNKRQMENIFKKYDFQTVFHAAAYKHVPLMELYPWEAVFNNIVGTKVILDLCHKKRVNRCVVVSTDKAVRPTNVMGASKRVIEQLVQSYSNLNRTRFMSVRFGNVIGSTGSVLPLFKKQIKSGGPVTVTHQEITRYFMTIPEAASLILQAGAMGKGGEILVLKMGTPIRIVDMAHDLITLSGFKPEEDIKIKYIGLRPGEKLYEELITEDETVKKTRHKDIMALNSNDGKPLDELNRNIERLIELAEIEDAKGIMEELKKIVPEYCPQWDGNN